MTRPTWLRRPTGALVRLDVSSPGSASAGFAAADALLQLGAHGHRRRRGATTAPAERGRRSSTTLGADVRLGDGADTLPAGAPTWSSPRRAGAPTRRCWPPRRPPGCRSGARSSWPGGCARAATPAPWLASPAPTARPRRCGCSTAMLAAAGHRAVAAGNVGTPARRGGARRAGPTTCSPSSCPASSCTGRARPAAARLGRAQRRAGPRRLARRRCEAYAADKGRVYAAHAGRRASTTSPTRRPSGWSRDADVAEGCRAVGFTLGVPGGRHARGRRRPAGRPGVRRGPARHARPSWPRWPTCGPSRRTTSRTRSPRPRWPGPTACRPPRSATGCAPSAPARTGSPIVAEVDGVRYVDDSKATNPHAAAASLAAYDSVVWIAGGLAKGADLRRPGAADRGPAARRRPARARPCRDRGRRSRDTRPRSRSSRSPAPTLGRMDDVVRAAASLAARRRHRAARPRLRLDGPVPRLRRARRRVRGRRPARWPRCRPGDRHRPRRASRTEPRGAAPRCWTAR